MTDQSADQTSRGGGSQAEADAHLAWSLAANCLLYESDPGPAVLNVASAAEPVWMDRSTAWQDSFARYLLEHLDADPDRLHRAHTTASADLAKARTPRFALDAYRSRRRSGSSRRSAARILRPGTRRELVGVYRRAIDLCRLALDIATSAGADHDPLARRRLLAATRHQNTVTALGVIPGVAEASSTQLAEDLDELDTLDPRKPGDTSGTI
ncbi:hypothetical protein [Pseudonocardia sp. WMMC193]|uniref:hypothetical protein n=1 Tax=Pseudonocardia sp. WMMC193 TaxID=2911965 RepID=UPI001F211A83|nr:hypothetical protein [Pseudonocardia sp. WMMC193]MCF7552188.1 hypothetical protein [Pseudonocardia sp. WMMC193]